MLNKEIDSKFYDVLREIEWDVADIEGWLSSRDIRFLALVAAHPCAKGEIVEIGAFRGKSTVVLAKAAKLVGQTRIYSCDPLNCDASPTHPDSIAIRKQLDRNLTRKNVSDNVEFHQTFSHDFAKSWQRPIRMLWIDGDHRFAAVRQDLDDFGRFLTDGAIVTMHDVVSLWDGVGRVFVEKILVSPYYGAAGIHGNIAWAQYRKNPQATAPFSDYKEKLAERLRQLIPIQHAVAGKSVHGFTKLKYRYLRWRAQPTELSPESWLKQVA